MKKIIFAALALLLSCAAYAQLNVKSSMEGPEKIAEAKYNFCALMHFDQYGYLMLMHSSNRYDKSGYFRLGVKLDEAIQSAKELRGLCDTIGEKVITVEAFPKRDCSIMADTHSRWLRFHFDRHAGYCTLSDKDLDIFVAALEALKPAEINAD